VHSYSSNLENGIPIKSYYGESNDSILPMLVPYLQKLKDIEDVRDVVLKDFFLKEITDIKKNECSP
jgi:hypothetical protein